jgi:hypothetical protein
MSTFRRQIYVCKLKMEDSETETPLKVVLYLNMCDMSVEWSRTSVLENQISAWK